MRKNLHSPKHNTTIHKTTSKADTIQNGFTSPLSPHEVGSKAQSSSLHGSSLKPKYNIFFFHQSLRTLVYTKRTTGIKKFTQKAIGVIQTNWVRGLRSSIKPKKCQGNPAHREGKKKVTKCWARFLLTKRTSQQLE